MNEYGDYTHYDTLEVDEDASQEIIESAYQYLCHKWHPKKHPEQRAESERRLVALSRAYRVISKPAKRAEYDKWLSNQRGEKSPAKAVFGERQFTTRPSDSKHTTENSEIPEAEFVDSRSSATAPPKFSKADFRPQTNDATFQDAELGDDELVFASFWQRGAAYMLDGLVATGLTLIIMVMVLGIALGLGQLSTMPKLSFWQLWQILGFPVGLLYYCAMTTRPRSCTVGQKYLGMKVLSVRGGGLSLPHAALRTVIRAFLLIFAIIQPFTRKRQALHDLLTGTVVVTSPEHMAKHGTAKAITIVLFVVVFLGGLIAGVTIPAYQDYLTRAKLSEPLAFLAQAKTSINTYVSRTGEWPGTIAETGYKRESINSDIYGPEIYAEDESYFVYADLAARFLNAGQDGRIALVPWYDENDVLKWTCYAIDVKASVLPKGCELWEDTD